MILLVVYLVKNNQVMAEYQPLRLSQESSEDEEKSTVLYEAATRESSHKFRWTISQRIKSLFLLISGFLNIVLVASFVLGFHNREAPTVEKSEFGEGLRFTVP